MTLHNLLCDWLEGCQVFFKPKLIKILSVMASIYPSMPLVWPGCRQDERAADHYNSPYSCKENARRFKIIDMVEWPDGDPVFVPSAFKRLS